jgi:hypothetical protein
MYADNVVPAAFESDDPSAAMEYHQNRINRLDGTKPYKSVLTDCQARVACSALDPTVPRALPWAVLFGPVGATEE